MNNIDQRPLSELTVGELKEILYPHLPKVSPIVNAEEVAKILGCTASNVYRLAKHGEIPSTHVGSKVVFNREYVIQYVQDKINKYKLI